MKQIHHLPTFVTAEVQNKLVKLHDTAWGKRRLDRVTRGGCSRGNPTTQLSDNSTHRESRFSPKEQFQRDKTSPMLKAY